MSNTTGATGATRSTSDAVSLHLSKDELAWPPSSDDLNAIEVVSVEACARRLIAAPAPPVSLDEALPAAEALADDLDDAFAAEPSRAVRWRRPWWHAPAFTRSVLAAASLALVAAAATQLPYGDGRRGLADISSGEPVIRAGLQHTPSAGRDLAAGPPATAHSATTAGDRRDSLPIAMPRASDPAVVPASSPLPGVTEVPTAILPDAGPLPERSPETRPILTAAADMASPPARMVPRVAADLAALAPGHASVSTLAPPPTPPPPAPPPAAIEAVTALGAGAPDLVSAVATDARLTVPEAVLDERRVQATLRRYEAAYTRLDAGAAKAVWPTVDARALARAFNGLESQDLEFDQCDLEVRGVEASALCSGRATWVARVGSKTPRTEARAWAFRLRKVGDDWQILGADIR